MKKFKIWLCARLAECFKQHLTEEEEDFLDDLEDFKEAAKEFVVASRKLSAYKGVGEYFYIRDANYLDPWVLVRLDKFTIDSGSIRLIRRHP